MKNIRAIIQPLGLLIEYDSLTFSGGERHIQIKNFKDANYPRIKEPSLELPKFMSKLTLDIRADIRSSNDLIDLHLLVNAFSQFYNDFSINLTLPYMPYARQDRACAPGQAFSFEVFSNLILALPNLQNITTWDIHSEAGWRRLRHKLTNISQVQILKHIDNRTYDRFMTSKKANPLLVRPDYGAKDRIKSIVDLYGFEDDRLVYATKIRDPHTGWITNTSIEYDNKIIEVGDDGLKDRTCIIMDDICDGGMTFIKIAEKLKAVGVGKIILFVTHGIFSKGFEPFEGLIDEFWTTNSFGYRDKERLEDINIKILEVTVK